MLVNDRRSGSRSDGRSAKAVAERHLTIPRLTAVDALRGAVMVIMALDHTREFFHAGAMSFSAEDLARTTPILFLTRWITHICAPTFVFLAGVGAFLRLQRDGSKDRLSRFLWTRGLWLVFIELTVMRLAMNFTVDSRYPFLLIILTALGVSMIALAFLIYLPTRALAVVSVAIVLLHNTLDGINASQFGAFAGVWNFLHQSGFFMLAGVPIVFGYPVLPWIGVMACGFCFGQVLTFEKARRQRVLVGTGAALIALFVLVRLVNVYGDPVPWSHQRSPVFTMLSFLRTTKYPPSLEFLLMTLGPALLLQAYFERREPGAQHPLVIVGRVPFFYYVAHFWLLHVVASAMAYVRYGSSSLSFLFMPLPSMGGQRDLFPPHFGYPLWVTYLVWAAVVVSIYPLCRKVAALKSRTRASWASYL
jgi:uncharacterized membrane protein